MSGAMVSQESFWAKADMIRFVLSGKDAKNLVENDLGQSWHAPLWMLQGTPLCGFPGAQKPYVLCPRQASW